MFEPLTTFTKADVVILASRNMGVEVIWWDVDYARPFW